MGVIYPLTFPCKQKGALLKAYIYSFWELILLGMNIMLGLQQPTKATLLKDFDLFLRDVWLKDFKDLLQVCPIKGLQ